MTTIKIHCRLVSGVRSENETSIDHLGTVIPHFAFGDDRLVSAATKYAEVAATLRVGVSVGSAAPTIPVGSVTGLSCSWRRWGVAVAGRAPGLRARY